MAPNTYLYLTGLGTQSTKHQHLNISNVIDFRAGIQFQDTAVITSKLQSQMDMLVQAAFLPRYAESLLNELHTDAVLPSTNPFSKSTTVTFEFTPSATPSQSSLSILTTTAIVAATVLMVLLGILLMYYYHHRRQSHPRRHRRTKVPKIVFHYNNESVHGDLIEIVSDGTDEDAEDGEEIDDVLRSSTISSFGGIRQPLIDTPECDSLAVSSDNDDDDATTRTCPASESNMAHNIRQPENSLWNTSIRPLKYTEPRIFEDVD
jgi:hypothetical protein